MTADAAAAAPTYAELTRRDPNPLKRWVQERRLRDALAAAEGADLTRVLDFGGGDGELTARLSEQAGAKDVICFEPAARLRAEADRRLQGVPRARTAAHAGDVASGWATTVFCLEVFEHLPPNETAAALDEIARAAAPGARLVFGVPVETGPPALFKGLFRAARRPGAYDASLARIAAATLGRPRTDRPLDPIGPGLPYHPHHLGFDHRRFAKALRERFGAVRVCTSPLRGLPVWLNSELYLIAETAR